MPTLGARSKRMQVIDHTGQIVLKLNRPATMARSTVVVRHANGSEIGRIAQKTLGIIGRVRFDLESGGQRLGSINAENWGDWDFSIQDSAGDEVARVTRTWAGFALSKASAAKRARNASAQRDKYVVEIHRSLGGPMHTLVIAAALAIDTALRQGS